MTTEIDNRLAELDLELPEPAAPGANYVPFVQTGNLVFVTGQLAQWNGERRFIASSSYSTDTRKDGLQQDGNASRYSRLEIRTFLALVAAVVGGALVTCLAGSLGFRLHRARSASRSKSPPGTVRGRPQGQRAKSQWRRWTEAPPAR